MENLMTNLEEIIANLIIWLGNVATALIGNEIFQIMLAVILFILVFNLIKNLTNEMKARRLGIGITGSTNELNFYRSLSEEEKEKWNEKHL